MPDSPTFVIRPVLSSDREAWSQLYSGYRAFYSLESDEEAVATTWRWVSTGAHGLSSLVAEDIDGRLLGLADIRIFARPSRGSLGLYLDDLFTAPESRGRGVARALLARVAEVATEHGADVVRWITAESNTTARGLYDSVATATPWVTYDMVPR